jgi:hypothetical protein
MGGTEHTRALSSLCFVVGNENEGIWSSVRMKLKSNPEGFFVDMNRDAMSRIKFDHASEHGTKRDSVAGNRDERAIIAGDPVFRSY